LHPNAVYILQAKNSLLYDFHYTIFGSDVGSNAGYSEFIIFLSLSTLIRQQYLETDLNHLLPNLHLLTTHDHPPI
jgi:hypothetical protein